LIEVEQKIMKKKGGKALHRITNDIAFTKIILSAKKRDEIENL